jgi:hypothetical protein
MLARSRPRPRVRPLVFAAGVAVAMAVAACGGSPLPSATPSAPPTPGPTSSPIEQPTPQGTPSPTSSPSPSPSLPSAQLLLEITSEGGFINPTAHLGELPQVVVDADGRIYTPDSGTAGTKVIQSVSVRDVGSAGAAQIVAAISAAGLDTAVDCGIAADAGVTVFTVELDGSEVVSRIAASASGPVTFAGLAGAATGCKKTSSAAFDLLAQLTDPSQTWGTPGVTTQTYDPVGYRLWFAPADSAAGAATVAWPLAQQLDGFGTPATPDYGVTGLRSGIVLGADAPDLGAALASAAPGDLLSAGGQEYQFWIRPLLPDELG